MNVQRDPVFRRVVGGGSFPRFKGDVREYEAAIERHAALLKQSGFTSVKVNEAVFSIPILQDPQNAYLQYTNWAYSLDEFCWSQYNRGIYPEEFVNLNREALVTQARLAERYGFRAHVLCCEPTFLPETFFKRHPKMRGPRVDNPSCSDKPLYAPCVHLPETQDHYRQMVRQLLQSAPNIDELYIFTNDSGAGICYSEGLYAGKNGPRHCRQSGVGKHLAYCCGAMCEAGREINPEFRVILTCEIRDEEREEFIKQAPEGVIASCYGYIAWMGGLEDRWANQHHGPIIQTLNRETVRKDQIDQYRGEVEKARAAGMTIYGQYSIDFFVGVANFPRPYEVARILKALAGMGVEVLWGGPTAEEWNVNTELFRRFQENPGRNTDELIQSIATDWAGVENADALTRAWRLTTEADGIRPMPSGGHCFYQSRDFMPGPLVPDFTRLRPEELEYYLGAVTADPEALENLRNGPWAAINYEPGVREWIISGMTGEVLPRMENARRLLKSILANPQPPSIKDCLSRQLEVITAVECSWRNQLHWNMAATHILADAAKVDGVPSFEAILDLDIQNTQDWLDNANGLGIGAEALRKRIEVMITHRGDPMRSFS